MKKLLLTTALLAGLTVASAQVQPTVAPVSQKSAVQYLKTNQVMQSRVNFAKSKVLKTVELAGGAATMQVVEDADGFIYKRYLKDGRILGNRLKGVKPVLKAAAGTTPSYFEGFESWTLKDGSDWIPKNMTEKNLPHNMPGGQFTDSAGVVYTNPRNLTWECIETGGLFMPKSSDGENEVYIHFGFDQKKIVEGDTIMVCPAMEQDEWLITPQITPKPNENLYFLAAIDFISVYDNKYLDWNTGKFSKREVVNTLSVNVSTDDGKTWTEVWDAVKDVAANMTDDDILWGPFFEYDSYKADLSAYSGKPIKIAFRYKRKQDHFSGNSLCLDGIMLGVPESSAAYMRPSGGLYAGFTENYNGIANSLLLLPNYSYNKWQNASGIYADTFEWEFDDPENPEAKVTFNEPNPELEYVGETVTSSPLLTVSVGGINASSYQWGYSAETPESKGFVKYGGTMAVKTTDGQIMPLGFGTLDTNNFINMPYFGAKSYCFGTGSSDIWTGAFGSKTVVDGIGNYFSKPESPYTFTKMWIHAGACDVDPDAEFTLVLHKLNYWGELSDTIATATCYGSDIIKEDVGNGETWYTIPFKFYKEDEFGYEVETYVEVNDQMFAELKGFNSPKVREFAAFSQAINHIGGENNCYVFLLSEQKDGTMKRGMYDGSKLLRDFNSSFFFQMDACFNWMKVSGRKFEVPVEGGSKVFDVNTYYEPQPQDSETQTWWIESAEKEEMDKWLTIEFIPSSETVEKPQMKVTGTALPEGVQGRKAAFTLKTIGASAKFNVVQGDAGVNNVLATTVSARNMGGKLYVTYTNGVNSMKIYSTSGQMVGAYALPENGNFVADINDLARGMYMVQFSDNQVVKFIK